MNITIARVTFDDHSYDERADVLYLNVGQPQDAARGWATPEGHCIHHHADDRIVGMTLGNVRWLLERDGELLVTLPESHLGTEALSGALSN